MNKKEQPEWFKKMKIEIEDFFNKATDEEIISLIDEYISENPSLIITPDKEREALIDELIDGVDID
jgi:hypothetical protein